ELRSAGMVHGAPSRDRGRTAKRARLQRAPSRGARRVLGRRAAGESLGRREPRVGGERAGSRGERRRAAPRSAARRRLRRPLALGQLGRWRSGGALTLAVLAGVVLWGCIWGSANECSRRSSP